MCSPCARENTDVEIIGIGLADHHELCLGKVQVQPNFVEVTI